MDPQVVNQPALNYWPLYAFCLIVGGGYHLVSILLGLEHDHVSHDLGLGHHLDVHDGDHGHDGPRLISLQTVFGFMAGFGALGIISSMSAVTLIISLFYSMIGGLVAAALIFWFLGFMIRQQGTSQPTDKDFVDVSAHVTTRIPDNGTVGEVRAVVRGQHVRFLAKAANPGETFLEGTKVVTKSYSGGIATVVLEPDKN